MKNQTAKLIPLIASGIAPTTVALAGAGDLDPEFGDLGRLGPIVTGPAWSLELQQDGTMLLGGGSYTPGFYYWGYYLPTAANFVHRVTDNGSIDSSFSLQTLPNSQVLDVARQPDGQTIAVGRSIRSDAKSRLLVFRVGSNGQLDSTFGNSGIVELTAPAQKPGHIATSVVLDPDGRIVIAGSENGQLVVLRLLPNGSFDDSFATSGLFTGPGNLGVSGELQAARTSIVRTAAGGYRVTTSNAAGCQIVALTASGAIDTAFGSMGIATAAAPAAASTNCNSMVGQPGDYLVIAGKAADNGFAARVLPDGQPDPGFSTDAVANALANATAVAAGDGGSILVAGAGVGGGTVMRLDASGELDITYGNQGSTIIDLHTADASIAMIRDLSVHTDGSVLAAGGETSRNYGFAVRLLGAGDSPGVLGMAMPSAIWTSENSAEVVVNVQRTGGSYGSVSVAYQTESESAVAGEDFTPVAGNLTWADGDVAIQQIHVPILSNAAVEYGERFRVSLSDTSGGAGLGHYKANIDIAPDGDPHGQFNIYTPNEWYPESGVALVTVSRDYYASGAVSVTLTPMSDTATADADFDPTPITLSWADGESVQKSARIPLVNDKRAEKIETFTVQLSNPTGGALIGMASSTAVRIQSDDQSGTNHGAGAFGYFSLLLLGLMKLLPAARRVLERRSHADRPHII